MKHLLLTSSLIFFFNIAFAQVGVNTSDPNTTLDVRAINHNGAVTNTDGILVPRVNSLGVNGFADGQLVYLIANDVVNGFTKGFHYWNTSTNSWTSLTSSSSSGNANVLKATANLDFVNLSGSTNSSELTAIVTGAAVGDACHCSPNTSLDLDLIWSCYVSSANTVTIRILNIGNNHNPPATDFNIVVTEF
jgi:hypothetical protein